MELTPTLFLSTWNKVMKTAQNRVHWRCTVEARGSTSSKKEKSLVSQSCFYPQATSPTAAQIEEEKLRRKLSELAGNISVPSSDEEAGGGKKTPLLKRAAVKSNLPVLPLEPLSSSSDEGPTEAQQVNFWGSCYPVTSQTHTKKL